MLTTVVDVTCDETGIAWPAATLPVDKWTAMVDPLRRAARAIQWWVGDWLLYGEAHYKEDVVIQTAWQLQLDGHTLENWRSVAKSIPRAERVPDLSWSHHRAVVTLPAMERRELLEQARPDAPDKPPRLSVPELSRLVPRRQAGATDEDALIADFDRHLGILAGIAAKLDDSLADTVASLTDTWRAWKQCESSGHISVTD